MRQRALVSLAASLLAAFLLGCGGSSAPAPPVVSVSLSPTQASVKAGSQFSFQASVQGAANTAVAWQLNGVTGGTPASGTISAAGVYTAPSILPSPPSATVTAVAQADTTKSASASVAITIGVAVTPVIASLNISSTQCQVTQPFNTIVTGTANSSVAWSVNGVSAGGSNAFGTIDTNGLYTSPSAIPAPAKFSVTATSQADSTQSGNAEVTISAGGPAANQAPQGTPVLLGTSGGNENDKSGNACCSGTLGALVTRNGINFILSNNHVLARADQAQLGEIITQPGLADNACQAGTAVATFTQAVQLKTGNSIGVADAALAQVIPGAVDSTGAILQLGSVNCGLAQPAPPASTVAAPTVGMPVAKSGRTTGLQCAAISEINVDNVKVQYQTSCGSSSTFTVTFNNQVVIESATFGSAGDSGSLIVEADTAQPTALLFGGDSTTGFAVANPIQNVLAALPDPSNQALPSIVGGASHAVGGCTPAANAASSQNSAGTRSPVRATAMERAKAAKSAHLAELTADPAVLGVGIGTGEAAGEAAIVVFMARGKPHEAIPARLDGVEVQVKTIGPFKAYGKLLCPAGTGVDSTLTSLRGELVFEGSPVPAMAPPAKRTELRLHGSDHAKHVEQSGVGWDLQVEVHQAVNPDPRDAKHRR